LATYKIGSQEGADFAAGAGTAAEVGDTVDLKLEADQERALIAAGWLEHDKSKKEANK